MNKQPQIFNPKNHTLSDAHCAIYSKTQIAYTINDIFAALTFIVGSILFFSPGIYTEIGTWLFLIGSICFGIRPSILLYREVQYMKLNK